MKLMQDAIVGEKRVLVRVDFNVPLRTLPDGRVEVADDGRIRAVLPTLNYLIKQKAKVILLSHLGRPDGKVVEEFRLDPVVLRLQELIGKIIVKCYSVNGEDVNEVLGEMKPGEIVMLSNLRFYPGEEKNDSEFAKAIAKLGDIYINDAFAVSHRAHASVEAITHFIPSYAGLLMEKEVKTLNSLIKYPGRPFVCIMGGAKAGDKIGVIRGLKDKIDVLLLGGAMANTFLVAEYGKKFGDSLYEENKIEEVRGLRKELETAGVKVVLPCDIVVSSKTDGTGEAMTINVNDKFELQWRILDIGPESVKGFGVEIDKAKTVFWNGNMGMSEVKPFDKGTEEIARILAESKATTIITGGDTTGYVNQAGLVEEMTYMSTGGGAALEFLAGKELPGVKALD